MARGNQAISSLRWLAAIGALLPAGCFSALGTEGGPCNAEGVCRPALHCVDGTCLTEPSAATLVCGPNVCGPIGTVQCGGCAAGACVRSRCVAPPVDGGAGADDGAVGVDAPPAADADVDGGGDAGVDGAADADLGVPDVAVPGDGGVPICTPRDTRCEMGVQERCAPDGGGWTEPQPCACGCAGARCAALICAPNVYECSGGERRRCDGAGCGWGSPQTCSCGCDGTSCAASVCTPNAYECSGGERRRCDGAGCGWGSPQTCSCGCDGTSCAACPDAGVPDLGVPDLGVPDLGVPDAGVPACGSGPDAGADAGVLPGYVVIPAGSVTLGSPPTELGRQTDGREDQHAAVTISRPFWMKATEVTQAQWRAVAQSSLPGLLPRPTPWSNPSPSAFASCGDDCPVEGVSWYAAVAYVNALSALEGLPECYTLSGCNGSDPGSGLVCDPNPAFSGVRCLGYRLPTEAEWEYAARAGTTSAFSNGLGIDNTGCSEPNLAAVGWYCGNAGSTPHGVRQKPANQWGLYDVHGNVWEWVHDWYLSGYYALSPACDPTGPTTTGADRVIRGGAWGLGALHCRSAFRAGGAPGTRTFALGFRPSRSFP